ncbi:MULTISPECIES: hypothetical protein [Streptomyces]|uniref:Uncharacterized protein n=1 Tax=Streptomyces chartreusis NRRL 3882 TaxID=1079985 RepID=A0A2N9AZQ5_STRCX|nr:MULTISPECIES: hypothetical protein [Streptomyces]MYS91660.1 hypothetical protein [Streptomyces sp. SID5464]SOR76532.1 hypothetical protein SCNRRL3882_0016 [Streptomyces chartreusis NRRL 3882]SOR84494.1 hypothetical protein SCNRRL3882_7939 [Streptomyces chartreusis NRRL 3882]
MQVTVLTDGIRCKVKPTSLHTDLARRTGYLLASLGDAEWEADPRTSCTARNGHASPTERPRSGDTDLRTPDDVRTRAAELESRVPPVTPSRVTVA